MSRGLRLTVRLPKAPDRLPGRQAAEVLHWALNDLAHVVERAPVPVRLVIEADPEPPPPEHA